MSIVNKGNVQLGVVVPRGDASVTGVTFIGSFLLALALAALE